MKSTMKFFKKAKLHENTAERDAQVKEALKARAEWQLDLQGNLMLTNCWTKFILANGGEN